MTLRKLTGLVLIAAPFIAIAVLSTFLMGLLATLGVFAVSAVIVGAITAGVTLSGTDS